MLEVLFKPRSVAVVGASGDPAKLAGRALLRLTQHAFPGDLYLVNPRRSEISGYRCYPSVTAIGEQVDVALITLPAAQVPETIRECGEAGVGFAVVVSSGFGEAPGSEALSADLADALKTSGIRLVGPNCEGIWSTPASMALTFGSAADRPGLLAGPVSLISQSGSIGGACIRELQDRGVGCRYFASTGNEVDLTAPDLLEYMIDEGGSRVIAMFIEGLRGGARLVELGRRAAARGIRLVALSAGASEIGKAATASHTGRMASSADVYRDLLRQSGVLQVATFAQLVDAIEVGAFAPLPGGTGAQPESGVGIVSVSGGSRALLADACERFGLPLATYGAATTEALDELLPKFGVSTNPTDLTGQVVGDLELFSQVLETVKRDSRTEALVVQYANGAEHQLGAQLELYRGLAVDGRFPVVISVLGRLPGNPTAALRDAGLITSADPSDAIERVGWLYAWRRFAAEQPERPAAPVPSALPGSLASWQARMAFLAEAGIEAPAWTIADPADPGSVDLPFPLVVKALPELAEHKTESGLVFVGIADRTELAQVFDTFRSRVPDGTPALVQHMVRGHAEVLLATRYDPDFGAVLVVGSGGTITELERDLAYVALPAGRGEIEAALRRLRLWGRLQPFRGRPACDVSAIIDAAEALSTAFLRYCRPGDEIELNPLIARLAGEGASAVDVLAAVATS